MQLQPQRCSCGCRSPDVRVQTDKSCSCTTRRSIYMCYTRNWTLPADFFIRVQVHQAPLWLDKCVVFTMSGLIKKLGKVKKKKTESITFDPENSPPVPGYTVKEKDIANKVHKAAWNGVLAKVKNLTKKSDAAVQIEQGRWVQTFWVTIYQITRSSFPHLSSFISKIMNTLRHAKGPEVHVWYAKKEIGLNLVNPKVHSLLSSSCRLIPAFLSCLIEYYFYCCLWITVWSFPSISRCPFFFAEKCYFWESSICFQRHSL